jgi:hypothetical protein
MWHEPDSSSKALGSTGKAEYSERGPLSLREHGGETYSLQSEHRRFTLTPHLTFRSLGKTHFLPSATPNDQSVAEGRHP